MTIQPAPHKILVRMHDLDTTTDIRIVLPETVAKLNPYGEVLAVGVDCANTSIGDKVLFMPAAAVGLRHNNEEVFLVDEGSVIGKYIPDRLNELTPS